VKDELLNHLQSVVGDRYTLAREIGHGGMAFVFLADDTKHQRQVAIKVLRPELASSIGSDRFLREIEVLSALQHPYILPMYDSGAEGGLLYFVMPFIEGESLKDRLIREPQLPLPDALVIARQVAAALAYAHERGIIHRDIKPENILLSAGEAVVADFGIAKAVRAAAGGDERLTETGLSVGTPAYMSPEHAAGEDSLDGRTDVYSLGCVLYEMLVGQPPFTGATLESIIRQHLTIEPQPVGSIRGTVPNQVDAVVSRALAKTPADRFSTAGQFVESLDFAAAHVRLSSGSIPIPLGLSPSDAIDEAPERSPRTVPWRWIGGTLAVVAIVLVAALRISGPSDAAIRLTVLPFEHLGDADDAYFTDGITDEVTTRLGAVGGLAVIGRQSALRYRGSEHTVPQIGDELGVEYLLQATVSWDSAATGERRVRVRSQLVRTGDQTQVWSDVLDEDVTELFAVQTRLAERVVEALGVTLLDGDRGGLGAHPTTSVAAYELFLRGSALLSGTTREDGYRAAQRLLERALEEDSLFARAAGQLARAHALRYWYYFDRSSERLEDARRFADRAMRLAPDDPESQLASASVHYYGNLDYDAAIRDVTAALERDPFHTDALILLGAVQRRQGRWAASSATFARALAADPRSAATAIQAGITHFFAGEDDAAAELFERAAVLAPEAQRPAVWMAALALGERADTAGARRWLARADSIAPRDLDPQQWMHWSVVRAVEGAEAAAGRLTGLFVDAPFRSLAEAELAWVRGDAPRTRVGAEAARSALAALLERQPDDPRYLSELGIALALLDQPDAALASARRAAELYPPSRDALLGHRWRRNLALVHAMVGSADSAAAILAPMLPTPGVVSEAWLQADPIWSEFVQSAAGRALLAGR
jgi:serine/threonine-protein kinase